MKKLYSVLFVLFLMSNIFAQEISVKLNNEKSTSSQTIFTGALGWISWSPRVTYDFSVNTDLIITGIKYKVTGPIQKIKIAVGGTSLASKEVGTEVHFFDLNSNITANTTISVDSYLSYSKIGIDGYPSGSNTQIQLTEVSYIAQNIIKTINLKVPASPLIILMYPRPQFSIPQRTAGAGTNVLVPIYSVNYAELEGIELIISSNTNCDPNYFNLDSKFYNSGWLPIQGTNEEGKFKVVATGKKIYLKPGEKIGEISFKIIKNFSGWLFPPSIVLYDGNEEWGYSISSLNIVNLPFFKYHDLNNDNLKNINDDIISFGLIGKDYNENILLSLANDLNGDGKNLSFDTYLGMMETLNSSNTQNWPIFSNHNYDYRETTEAINLEWRRISNNQWGLFSTKEPVTNGDLIAENFISISGNGMFKQLGKNIHFIDLNFSTNKPILIADNPVQLTGTVNEDRQISTSVSSITAIEVTEEVPINFVLDQNYPNPFNPSTTISYSIPINGFVTLKVYDVIGKEVAELVNEQKNAGRYEVNFNASKLASGMYIYKLTGNNISLSKKMILMK